MRSVSEDTELNALAERVLEHARAFGRQLPEMRFFILDHLEFASLLEKHVYPTSPLNVWEGKRMVHKKHRIASGQESSLYYEVVQTGNPSYAYLNDGNSAVTQASVMAHVVGHCEFSELNVMHDSTADRTEYVMYLVKKADLARGQMGQRDYLDYWNACESVASLIAANSQYNLARSIDTEAEFTHDVVVEGNQGPASPTPFQPVSGTMLALMKPKDGNRVVESDVRHRRHQQMLSRRGYALRAPCQDVFGFLLEYAPKSSSERTLMDYMYVIRAPQEFVMRTQIMNEGWAMYWEKKIMLELFKEKAVKGIIDYSRVFSSVCSPRPYFQRNPYHLGYNMWCHVEALYAQGRVNLAYREEIDQATRDTWCQPATLDPVDAMTHLVGTVTDYEFLRRFLTTELVHEFHLNRIDRRLADRLGIEESEIVQMDKRWVWVDPGPVKEQMLGLFSHFYRPRIYVIDNDFVDGGLLLFHRDDGRALKASWISPTLKNLNRLWKGHVALLSRGKLYRYQNNRYAESDAEPIDFEHVVERMRQGKKPYAGA